MGTLAYKLGLTQAKLSEACRLLAIPVPPRGYWNAIRAGKSIPPIPLPEYDGPRELRIESARERASKELGALAPAKRAQVAPRYVTLDEWAQATFSHPPHKNTLFRWVNEGRIQPQPRKIGRRWWVEPTAEYRAD
jgi:hypothetical protein